MVGQFERNVATAVAKLKENIKDLIPEDGFYAEEFYLLRWLAASNMKVGKAEKNLRNAVKWRKSFDVQSLYNDTFPPDWLESLPIYADAVTQNGSVAASVQAGIVDLRGILEETGREKTVKYLVQAFVQVEKVLVDLNKQKFGGLPVTETSIDGGTIVIDVGGFSARQLGSLQVLQTVGEVCRILVKYFPYICSKIVVINCNTTAAVILKIMRSILESATLKFEMYGHDKSEWEGAVRTQIPEHLLRDVFGGTRPTEKLIKRNELVDREMLLSYASAL